MSSSRPLLLLLALAVPSAAQDYRLKIGLVTGAESARVLIDENTRVRDLSTGEMVVLATGTLTATSEAGLVVIGGHFSAQRVEISHPSNLVVINGESYPGRIVLRSAPEGLTAVNELDLETYLEGVLPHEMANNWPIEALRAQAVVSRTYAVYNLGQYHADGFDLSSDIRSQVYKGLKKRNERIREAVESTKGEVLTYKGQVLNTFFHASCGGHTRASHKAWAGTLPAERPLKGVVDNHCALSPHAAWEAYFPSSEILRAVQEAGHMVTKILKVSAGKRERSGHAENIKIRTDQGDIVLPTDTLRRALDPSLLKSGLIVKIIEKKNGFEFQGRGFGHGVGLCQWGSREQALKGRLYRKILDFYYPGSVLRRLE